MTRHRYLISLIATSVAFLATSTANSAVVYFDHFDSLARTSASLQDFTTTSSFSATPAIGPPLRNWLVGSGRHETALCDMSRCVDLDGRGSANYAYLYTGTNLNGTDGVTRELRAVLRGNGRGQGSDTVVFGFGNPNAVSSINSDSDNPIILGQDDPPAPFSLFWTATFTGPVKLFFQNHTVSDNFGAVLESVKLSIVPLPVAVWLLLSGLAGVGMIARLRRSGISSAIAV